jgi:orotidine-5'-phosphate decarboxylase
VSHPDRTSISTPTAGFAERWRVLRGQRGPFCLGLDPSPELLAAWGLSDDAGGLQSFCEGVIDAAAEHVSVFKPQSAFFERFGGAGLSVLAGAIEAIHARGSLVLLDVKRGDIGSTNRAYADAMLGPESAMRADAITLHAYLGFAALRPFFDHAEQSGSGLFPVVLSSNPEGASIQQARLPSGLSVAEHLSDEITRHNQARSDSSPSSPSSQEGGAGPIGAVVGLTAAGASELVARLPQSLILVPGLGAQGGSFEQLAARFAAARSRVIPSASRGVLGQGPDRGALRRAIDEHCARAAQALS